MKNPWEQLYFEEVFLDIETDPIGTASIGCVYKAKLKESAEEVIIKVQKPGIRRQVRTDFDILLFIINQTEKVAPDLKYLGIRTLLKEFQKSLELELNFVLEALNCERIRKSYEERVKDYFVIPKVYKKYSSQDILVQEFLHGKPFNEVQSVSELGENYEEKIQKCVSVFIQTLLHDGFYHADLHGGNFFLLEDKRIGIIDFGLMGTLGKKSRNHLIAILYALVNHDYPNLVYEFLEVAEYEALPQDDLLIRDVQDSLSQFVGLDVQDMDIQQLFNTIVGTLSKHQIFLPREWFTIFRALVTLDGVGKSLGLELNLFELLEKDIRPIIKDIFSVEEVKREALWLGHDVIGAMRMVPRHIKWFLRESAKRQYSLEINFRDQERQLEKLHSSIGFLGFIFLSGIFFLIGGQFIHDGNITRLQDIPILSWILWSFGMMFLLRSLFLMRK